MNDLKIVFVEINRLPRYAIENIVRLRQLFPMIDLVLLTDSATFHSYPRVQEYCQIFLISAELDQRLINLSRYQNSRDSFWIYTTQRLFVLCEYHAKNPTSSILHVESDVILMPNFPFDKLLSIKTLLWGNYNLTHDVASLVYLPDIDSTNLLLESMKTHLKIDSSHSDMTLLRTVAEDLGANHGYFPSLPIENSVLINSRNSWPREYIDKQYELFDIFGGIFDHQIIGMYLDGLDPHLTYGLRETLFDATIVSGESLIDPSDISFSVNDNIELIEKDFAYPLYSIHLHSKNLELFDHNCDLLARRADAANHNLRNLYFDVKVFWELVTSNFQKRTLCSWAKHLTRYIFSRFMKVSK